MSHPHPSSPHRTEAMPDAGRRPPRVVVILELLFRDAQIRPEAILRAHGIVPTRPYDHEHLVVHGAPAHRYTQPPRAQAFPHPQQEAFPMTDAPAPDADPVLAPGALLVCTEGEYADYRTRGVYRVMRPLSAAALAAFRAAPPHLVEPSIPRGPAWHAFLARYSPSSFLAWLVTAQYLQPVPALALSLGAAQAAWHVEVPCCGTFPE
jgi:hypothetical protein